MASAPQNKSEIKSNWRTEITGRGRYFHWRSGSGRDRKYMRGGRIDKLPPERIEAYNRNATKKKRKSNTKRGSSHNAEYAGALGRDRAEVLNT